MRWLRDLGLFLATEKKWWVASLLAYLAALALLARLLDAGAGGSFIYPIF